jgi:hypothetical protein
MLNGLLTSMISFLCLLPFGIVMSGVQQSINMEKIYELQREIDSQQIDMQKVVELENEIGIAKILYALLFFCLGTLFVAYLSFIWVFSLQLTIDKRMKFWPAMEISRRIVNHHAWRMALLLCASGLIAASGILLFRVGLLVTLPIYIGAVMFAYDDIFGEPHRAPELPGEGD